MKKKTIAILLCMALLLSAAFAGCRANIDEEETNTPDVSESQPAVTENINAAETTAQNTEEQTTEGEALTESTTENKTDISFIKGGYWYYYDDNSRTAYAVSFDGSGNVSVAYFDTANVDGEDSKYFEGTAKYAVAGNTLNITALPDALGIDAVSLKIDNGGLYYGNTALEKHDNLSLNYPFDHFNE